MTQATQSNGGTVFFRAVVMLGFLGVIFYAALCGNALPDAARKQIEKYLPESMGCAKTAVADDAESPKASAGEAPLYNNVAAAKSDAKPEALPLMSLKNPDAPRKLPVDKSASMLPAASAKVHSGPVVPVNYQAPLEAPPATAARSPLEEAAQQFGASLNPQPVSSPFSEMQSKLRQLGATYYLLETWGNEQQFYRFYCKMAVGGNTNYTRCFESTDADPLAAMSAVLKQVEEWRGGATR
jgi:hypothetical protein